MSGNTRNLTTTTQWRFALLELISIYGSVSREADIARVIDWAKRKRLVHARRLNEARFADEQVRLARYRWRSPGLVEVAYWVYTFKQTLWPSLRYPRRGAAAKYRYAR